MDKGCVFEYIEFYERNDILLGSIDHVCPDDHTYTLDGGLIVLSRHGVGQEDSACRVPALQIQRLWFRIRIHVLEYSRIE